jgi:hypothetical protein
VIATEIVTATTNEGTENGEGAGRAVLDEEGTETAIADHLEETKTTTADETGSVVIMTDARETARETEQLVHDTATMTGSEITDGRDLPDEMTANGENLKLTRSKCCTRMRRRLEVSADDSCTCSCHS